MKCTLCPGLANAFSCWATLQMEMIVTIETVFELNNDDDVSDGNEDDAKSMKDV